MKKSRIKLCLFCCLILVPLFVSQEAIAAKDTRFVCGGSVEAEVWESWDSNIRDFMNQRLLQDRLVKQGDVYALYDFQTYTHNMVSMARRCNRTSRLMEIADMVRTAYGVLDPGKQSAPGRQWVCRGGSVCNDKNGLLNREVMLCSVQFLALATSVANALALSSTSLGKTEKEFIRDTAQIAKEHLLRWGDKNSINMIRKTAIALPQDVKDESPRLLFTDKSLWMITIYAELAGIFRAYPQEMDSVFLSDNHRARLNEHLSVLLNFFSSRISIRHVTNARLGEVDLADIDRGYWRLHDINRYAGYEDTVKPVECSFLKHDKTKFTMKVNVRDDSVQKRNDIGWDFSHARRLVHALDALERNRDALRYVFSLKEKQLPAENLPTAFANTLVAVIWNGDKKEPLFSNYLSGANGWYRVAYDNKTGKCIEGTPPYGMTDSFATGGYIAWARYRPVIGQLGQRLYDLISTPDGASSPFIVKYYQRISKSASTEYKNVSMFMFLPSLVGVINK